MKITNITNIILNIKKGNKSVDLRKNNDIMLRDINALSLITQRAINSISKINRTFERNNDADNSKNRNLSCTSNLLLTGKNYNINNHKNSGLKYISFSGKNKGPTYSFNGSSKYYHTNALLINDNSDDIAEINGLQNDDDNINNKISNIDILE